MVKLSIDERPLEVEEGILLIEAARSNGIHIPSLCYRQNLADYASCSVCLVKERSSGTFLHACATPVQEGMNIDASSQEVLNLRKEAISLLLSEHRAECLAPCQRVCPLGLNIPLMNRHIQKNNFEAAAGLVLSALGLPETVCFLCSAYCENACRRRMIDQAVAIMDIKTSACITARGRHILPGAMDKSSGKNIAIIGSGITGLVVSFFLAREGHQCTIFEKSAKAGGRLLNRLENDDEAKRKFDDELKLLQTMGIEIKYNHFIDETQLLNALIKEFHTVVIAAKECESSEKATAAASYLLYEGDSFILKGTPLFKTGSAVKQNRLIVRDIGQSKKMALGIAAFLKDGNLTPLKNQFSSTIGKIEDSEKNAWLLEIPEEKPGDEGASPINPMVKNANRCMHCDCRAIENCQLRAISTDYGLKSPQTKIVGRLIEKKIDENSGLIFENAKCIKCGLCVRILKEETHQPTLGFQGRGIMSIISEPLTHRFDEIPGEQVDTLVNTCPTAALSKREHE